MTVAAPPDTLGDVLRKLRLSRRHRRLADDVEAVLALIPGSDGQPAIHREELMRRTGLGRARIAYVVKFVRHNIPEIGEALVSGPEGYRLTLDEAGIARCRRLFLVTARTRIVTARRIAERGFRLVDRNGSRDDRVTVIGVRRSMDRVIEDLELLTL